MAQRWKFSIESLLMQNFANILIMFPISYLINRSTTTLSNCLLCNILQFSDNQFNDITNMLILESTVDFCKKLGDSSAFLRCLMALGTLASLHLISHRFLLSLDTFLDTSSLLLLLSNPRNPMAPANTHSVTVVMSWALNLTCIAPSNFQCLPTRLYCLGVEIRGIRRYDNTNNWNLLVVN